MQINVAEAEIKGLPEPNQLFVWREKGGLSDCWSETVYYCINPQQGRKAIDLKRLVGEEEDTFVYAIGLNETSGGYVAYWNCSNVEFRVLHQLEPLELE